LCTKLV